MDGWGSELATALWLFVIPSAIAIVRWYVKEQKERAVLLGKVSVLESSVKSLREKAAWKDSLHDLKKAIVKLEDASKIFDEFMIRYDTMETETQKKISSLIDKAENWSKFQAEWRGYRKAQLEKSGSYKRPGWAKRKSDDETSY